MKDIKLFQSNQIRSVWSNESGEWLFSVVDVVGALTDQPSVDRAKKYWSVLKSRLKKEGNETTTNCSCLKMKAIDGKMRLTDVANTIIENQSNRNEFNRMYRLKFQDYTNDNINEDL